MPVQLGYCTNVHAGADWETTRANLAEHAVAVKAAFRPAAPLGIGLWLSASAAGRLRGEAARVEFAGWLRDAGLVPFTLNGFPYGDFHRPVVKHDVYRPTWRDAARLEYTLDLIDILDALLPAGADGSISTLPVQWGAPPPSADQLRAAAENLRRVAHRLARLEQDRGRWIRLCLEPEPGCVLQRSADVVRFFEECLLPGGDEDRVRRYLQVCHDICHAAVMFEDQAETLARYRAAGLGVGKIQVSSALVAPLDRLAPDERVEARRQLRDFAEDRYLHQTTIRRAPDAAPEFFEDLPAALDAGGGASLPAGQWRVHFHVPIYVQRFGLLETTQAEILACLAAAQAGSAVTHYEVETYAWNVLPAALRQPRLADGIARELQWFGSRAGLAAEP